MNYIFTFISITVAFMSLKMGMLVYRLDKESRVNRTFFALSICIFIWLFADGVIYSALNEEMCWVMNKMASVGYFLVPPIALQFFLLLSNSKFLLERKWLSILTFIPAFFLMYMNVVGHVMASDYVHKDHTWYVVNANETLNYWIYLTYVMIIIPGIISVALWGFAATSNREKKQAKTLVKTAMIIMTELFIFEVFMPFYVVGNFILPIFESSVAFVLLFGFWKSIFKYRLLNLTPTVAVEEILSKIKDLFILVDVHGKIVDVNSECNKILQLSKEELVGANIISIFTDWNIVVENSYEESKDYELHLKIKSDILIPVKFSYSSVKDDFGDLAGYACIVHDLRREKQLEEMLIIQNRAKRALEDTEEKYRTVVDNANDGIVIVQNRVIKFANNRIESIVGISKNKIINTLFYNYIYDEDRYRVLTIYAERLHKTGLNKISYRIVSAQGKPIWVESSSVPIMWEDVPATLHFISDISLRKQIENKIEEDTIFLQRLIDTIPNPMYFKDCNGIFKLCNEAFKKFVGIEKNKIIGNTVYFIADNEVAEQHCKMDQKVLENRETEIYEGYLRDGDGVLRDGLFYKAPFLNAQGQLLGVVGIIVDITERKKAEAELKRHKENLKELVTERTEKLVQVNKLLEEDIQERNFVEAKLRESEEKYRTLFNNLNEAVIVVKRDERQLLKQIVDVNDAACNMFGYQRYEFIDIAFNQLIGKENYEQYKKFISESSETVETVYEMNIEKQMGISVPVEMSVHGFAIQDQKVVLVMLRNIKQRKEAEEQVQQYQEKLRALSKELSIVEEKERHQIATEIHDYIGQALAAAKIKLLGISQEMTSEYHKQEMKKISAMVSTAIEHTRTLTFELSPPILYELGLVAAIEWLCDQFSEQHDLHFQVKEDSKLALIGIEIDNDSRMFIFKAIRELLYNIVKHAQAKNVKITLSKTVDKVLVSVADDGVGFDLTTLNKNAGFGLFSIRERLKLVDGLYRVESKLGEGTTITLELPYSNDRLI